jgi:hypothetical protein
LFVDSARINDWIQVIGIFAVVASLIFVGLQMQLDREIALSAATQARTDTTIQDISTAASNPIYMSAIDKIELGDTASLLPSEKRAVWMHNTATLFNLENVYSQYLSGYLSQERWKASRQTLKGLLRPAYGPRRNYEQNPAAWMESFQLVVDELIGEIDAEAAVGN